MKLVNLGCGNSYHKDWINFDFVSNNESVASHNLLEGIPLADNEVNVVYHSHILEHFSKKDGFSFIKECYRVLKKDGIIRIAVPDLESIAKEYLKNLDLAIEGNEMAKHNYEWIKLELFDQMVRNESGGSMKDYLYQSIIPNVTYVFKRIGSEGEIIREAFLKNNGLTQNISEETPSEVKVLKLKVFLKKLKRKLWKLYRKIKKNQTSLEQSKEYRIGKFRTSGEIHQWMYDRYSLAELLKSVGFSEIKVYSAFESQIQNWDNYQLDVINGKIRKPDSLFMEAKKL
ncbi:class I SAM-dependent methyltransferase [Flavobacterium daemonense]|uniref:class I SAM-dependent methyltransferase n=1 Tax=Flavobacterium daemonense TaxID=1393049 RepID=UPI001185211B|nr:methyltransferase domain-containing protein [Flavobacterium daemonense]KAF2333126.1 methyltransferase domain-containing protein [Flavobacterium daemonense]